MEILFSRLKKMDVVSITDGKNLGKVCDIAFYFPENCIKGFWVTGCKGFRFSKEDVFIPIADVTKIGEDVVLVKFGKPPKDEPPPRPPQPYPPQPYPPQHCPPGKRPPNGNPPPFQPPFDPRRNFDDYE